MPFGKAWPKDSPSVLTPVALRPAVLRTHLLSPR